jgi:hypothetical protein
MKIVHSQVDFTEPSRLNQLGRRILWRPGWRIIEVIRGRMPIADKVLPSGGVTLIR